MKKLINNIEMIIGSIAISITVSTVILNVFLRYGFGIQFPWIEEVSVGCFIWSVFMGATAAFKKKELLGVDILTQALPFKGRRVLEVFVHALLFGLCSFLFYLSLNYTMNSNKITVALEVSYVYINSALVFSFGLMAIYSLRFLVEDIKELKKDFSKKEILVKG